MRVAQGYVTDLHIDTLLLPVVGRGALECQYRQPGRLSTCREAVR